MTRASRSPARSFRRRAGGRRRVVLPALVAFCVASLAAAPARSGPEGVGSEGASTAPFPAGPSCQAVPPERTATSAGVLLEVLAARAGAAGPGDGSGTISLNARGYNYGPGRTAAAPPTPDSER